MRKLLCFIMLLALCLSLGACSGCSSKSEVTDPTTEPLETETTAATLVTEEPSEPATEAPLLYTNPLTGEATGTPATDRPYAVMLNNIKAAMPQHGVSQADILYEVLAEGNITRCLGIYSNVAAVEKLGSIRSARKYYVDLAMSYDAIYVHAGGSDEAYSYLSSTDYDHIDGVKGSGASKYYYRDKDRLNSGYSLEHTMFISGQDVVTYATAQKCILAREQDLSYGLRFSADNTLTGSEASTVTVYFNTGSKPGSSTKKTIMTYNTEDGLYYAAQYDADYIDGNTGAAIAFKNILVLQTKVYTQSDGKHRTVELTGSGTGYYACGGQIIPILWSRKSEDQPFAYTLEDGSALTLGIGKTYVGIVPAKGVVEYQ